MIPRWYLVPTYSLTWEGSIHCQRREQKTNKSSKNVMITTEAQHLITCKSLPQPTSWPLTLVNATVESYSSIIALSAISQSTLLWELLQLLPRMSSLVPSPPGDISLIFQELVKEYFHPWLRSKPCLRSWQIWTLSIFCYFCTASINALLLCCT